MELQNFRFRALTPKLMIIIFNASAPFPRRKIGLINMQRVGEGCVIPWHMHTHAQNAEWDGDEK